jgi:SAM-dependent methyltransferase
MLTKNFTKNSDGVFIQNELDIDTDFEKVYYSLRASEHRIYSNEELASLPEISLHHELHSEWEIRKRNSIQFIDYLKQKNKLLKILEIGCGNGWLAHKIALVNNTEVLAIDLNYEELKQASLVFKNKENLHFAYGNMESVMNTGIHFDCIVFSASIQYFPSLKDCIIQTFSLLNDNGEIHILDSILYKAHQIDAAKERSKSYFQSIGFEKMSNQYFHHSVDELDDFNYAIIRKPSCIQKYIFRSKNPFFWIRIFKNKV